MSRHVLWPAAVTLAVCWLAPWAGAAGFTNFREAGTTVNGYQDDFPVGERNPDWLVIDGGNDDANPLFDHAGGTTVMRPANGDPNKLLYNPATPYDATSQNVLALVQVRTPGSGDGFRGGVAANSAPSGAELGRGFNLHFRNHDPATPHFRLLDDARAWGPRTSDTPGGDTWQANQWKWLRLVTNATTVQGKVWDAGTTPEPEAFDVTWTRGGRTGLAGLVTNSVGGQGTLVVDYVLIQAEGLPSIQVIPEPASLGLVSLVGLVLLARRRR